MPANVENSAVATGFRKGQISLQTQRRAIKECTNYHTTVVNLNAGKVMLKIFQARLQQYVTQELLDVQDGFRKEEPEIKLPTSVGSQISFNIGKSKEFQKNIYSCFTEYAKAFDFVDHNKWKILKEMGVPDHPAYLLRNLYEGQEATI